MMEGTEVSNRIIEAVIESMGLSAKMVSFETQHKHALAAHHASLVCLHETLVDDGLHEMAQWIEEQIEGLDVKGFDFDNSSDR